jgi:hypothetical protein
MKKANLSTALCARTGAPVLVLFAIVSWPEVVSVEPTPVIFVGKGKGKHRFKH